MSDVVAVCFSDSHVTDKTWLSRPGIVGDSYYSLQQIFDAAVDYGVLLIAAGDLLEKAINRSGPVVEFLRQLDRLEANKCFFLQGQHDLADPPWLSGHPAAVHVHKQVFHVGGFSCYGLDYLPAGTLQQELEQIPAGTDILVAHQVWLNLCGQLFNPQGSAADIPVVHTVISGDNHASVGLFKCKGKDGQEIKLLSPGSTYQTDISETADKCFWLLLDNGTFRKVPLLTRKFIDWPLLSVPAQVDSFVSGIAEELAAAWSVQGLPEHIRMPLLRVTYSAKLAEHRSRILKAVNDKAHLFFRELPPEPSEAVAWRMQKKEESGERRASTLASELDTYLEAENLKSLGSDARRLVESEDIAGELARMRAEALQ